MAKMKLLAPAGDLQSLKMAIMNGADEVYLGVKDFNARNIEGFSVENLKQAVDYAHIYGVKVHLTVNILFKDEEMQSALDLVVQAFNFGVDAFIVQDLGLANLIHKYYPQIEMVQISIQDNIVKRSTLIPIFVCSRDVATHVSTTNTHPCASSYATKVEGIPKIAKHLSLFFRFSLFFSAISSGFACRLHHWL